MERHDVATALLRVYAHRADRNTDHQDAVISFAMAVLRQFEVKSSFDLLVDQFDAARCALYRLAHDQEPDEEYTAALRALAPDLLEWRRCPECRAWGRATVHTLACSKIKE